MEENSVDMDEDGDAWLATYADAITLLMAFFVILLSMAETEKSAITGDKPPGAPSESVEQVESVIAEVQEIEREMRQIGFEFDLRDKLQVTDIENGVLIELSDTAVFRSGSARIKRQAGAIISRISEAIGRLEGEQSYRVAIEGHTDDRPMKGRRGGGSNWELSSKRATNVLRRMLKRGIPSENLRAIAYAHTRPKKPNRDARGRPIRANRAANRRVAIRLEVLPMEQPLFSQAP